MWFGGCSISLSSHYAVGWAWHLIMSCGWVGVIFNHIMRYGGCGISSSHYVVGVIFHHITWLDGRCISCGWVCVVLSVCVTRRCRSWTVHGGGACGRRSLCVLVWRWRIRRSWRRLANRCSSSGREIRWRSRRTSPRQRPSADHMTGACAQSGVSLAAFVSHRWQSRSSASSSCSTRTIPQSSWSSAAPQTLSSAPPVSHTHTLTLANQCLPPGHVTRDEGLCL